MASQGARVVIAFLGGRTAFGLSYLIGAARDLPIPWYLPLDRTFVFSPRPPVFAMEWFGRSFVSMLIASAVVAALWLASARGPLVRALQRPAFVLALAQAAGLALLVDFAYFGFMLLRQPVSPLPLPPGYAP